MNNRIYRKKNVLGVIGFLIILLTLVIQVSDSQINKFEMDLLTDQGTLNNILLMSQERADLQRFWMETAYIDPKEVVVLNFECNDPLLIYAENSLNLSSECDLRKKLYGYEISKKEFIYEEIKYNGAMGEFLSKMYDAQLDLLNQSRKDGTPWTKWKRGLIVSQIILIILGIFISLEQTSKSGR